MRVLGSIVSKRPKSSTRSKYHLNNSKSIDFAFLESFLLVFVVIFQIGVCSYMQSLCRYDSLHKGKQKKKINPIPISNAILQKCPVLPSLRAVSIANLIQLGKLPSHCCLKVALSCRSEESILDCFRGSMLGISFRLSLPYIVALLH